MNHRSLLPALLAGVALLSAPRAGAQTFTNLHSFNGVTDGGHPYPTLVLSGNTLYGTTSDGGSQGNGGVFAVNTDGGGFTNLHSFAYSEGINPYGGLILSGVTLYGTTSQGGATANGTVFSVNADGTGFTVLHTFTGGRDGMAPYAGLVLDGATMFGVASQGGDYGRGDVFAINTDGGGFTNLHSFTGGLDGAGPYAGLVLAGGALYGATTQGGGNGEGVLFSVNTDGTDFTTLYSFSGTADGAHPRAALFLAGTTLFGATSHGGGATNGTVFSLDRNGGASITNLHNFTGAGDGGNPNSVLLSGNILYGTTSLGGANGDGIAFALDITGADGFTNLYNFTGASDGASPRGGLLLSGGVLYGTTSGGGRGGDGTVFALSLSASSTNSPNPIPLNIQWAGDAVVLSWTNSAFALQFAPALTGAFTTIPGSSSAYTNPITGAQGFFRLSR